MSHDVDFLRGLLLELEVAQRSPPEPIFTPVAEFARRFGKPEEAIVAGLELLTQLDFIEGPGAYHDGAWLFRKLTRRGVWLAEAIRDPRDWRIVKGAYGDLLDP